MSCDEWRRGQGCGILPLPVGVVVVLQCALRILPRPAEPVRRPVFSSTPAFDAYYLSIPANAIVTVNAKSDHFLEGEREI